MNKDTRLSGVLHVLLHMAQVTTPLTSEVLANTMGTNPAVFRRTMAGLRKAGHVQSGNGPGGGWSLARPLAEITLLDVYRALGNPGLFAIASRKSDGSCQIERAVNLALADTLAAAEALFLARFGTLTLASLAAGASSPLTVHCKPALTATPA
jgi:Rrf2 family protein